MRNPCHGCYDRNATCHGSCVEYKTWKADHDIKVKQDREAHENRVEIPHNVVRKIWRSKRWK